MKGLDVLRRANPAVAAKVQEQDGMLDADDLKALIVADKRVEVEVLVRCNGGRFVCPAAHAPNFLRVIAEHAAMLEEKHPGEVLPPGVEWVRDVALLASVHHY